MCDNSLRGDSENRTRKAQHTNEVGHLVPEISDGLPSKAMDFFFSFPEKIYENYFYCFFYKKIKLKYYIHIRHFLFENL